MVVTRKWDQNAFMFSFFWCLKDVADEVGQKNGVVDSPTALHGPNLNQP
ncbi:unnamed protein product [Rhodiola kirilowii]